MQTACFDAESQAYIWQVTEELERVILWPQMRLNYRAPTLLHSLKVV